MSEPQILFSKEAMDALIQRLKAQRDNPIPMTIGLHENVGVLPSFVAFDFWDNALADENCANFLRRRFGEGYRFKDGRWGK